MCQHKKLESRTCAGARQACFVISWKATCGKSNCCSTAGPQHRDSCTAGPRVLACCPCSLAKVCRASQDCLRLDKVLKCCWLASASARIMPTRTISTLLHLYNHSGMPLRRITSDTDAEVVSSRCITPDHDMLLHAWCLRAGAGSLDGATAR